MTTTTEKQAGLEPNPQSETTPNRIPCVPIHNFSWMDGMGEDESEVAKDAIADEITDQVKEVIQDKPISESDIKPTQQQINSGRFFWILAGVVAIAFGFSLIQQPKQTETLMESRQPSQEPQVQTAQLVADQAQTQPVKQVETQPLPERDPTANARNFTALDIIKDANQVNEKAPEARARFLYAQWQQLAIRNPQSYKAYLLTQLKRVNTAASKLSLDSKTSLIGSAEQLKIALDLSVELRAIASELSCVNIADGKMQAPEKPLDCQNVAVTAPSITIAKLIKNSVNLEYYEGVLQQSEAQEETERALAIQAQRLKANTKPKPVVGILNK